MTRADSDSASFGLERMKRAAAEAAVDRIESGMVVGLGTGSTARYAVERLGRRLGAGDLQDIVGIPTSIATEVLAQRCGIPLTTLEARPTVDVTVDGADEVSPTLDLVKGMGGALVREKIVACASRRVYIAVDETKLVQRLGTRSLLPVALVPFGAESQLSWLTQWGSSATMRRTEGGQPFVTDDGLAIAHIGFDDGIPDAARLERNLRQRTGVVDTGLFLEQAAAVFVGTADGVRVLTRPGADEAG